MKSSVKKRPLVLLATLVGSHISVHSEIIWSSSPMGNTGEAAMLGQSFSTDKLNSPQRLDSITVEGSEQEDESPNDYFTAELHLFKNASNNPELWTPTADGIIAKSTTAEIKVGQSSTFKFLDQNKILLAPDSVYLIKIVRQGGGRQRIAFSDTPVGLSATGCAFKDTSATSGTSLKGYNFGVSVNTDSKGSPSQKTTSTLLSIGGIAIHLKEH